MFTLSKTCQGGAVSLHPLDIMIAYLDAVVGLGDALVQGLAVRLQQLSLALCLTQLLLCQPQLMMQLGIRLLQHVSSEVMHIL